MTSEVIRGRVSTTPSVGRERLSRRAIVTAALAAGLTVPLGLAGRARAAAVTGPVRLVLPAPSGPIPIGTVPLRLVDRSRPDPIAGPGHFRELMVSVWYPAREVARYPRARWLADAPTRALLTAAGFPADTAAAPLTAGHVGAPVRRAGGRLPVVVFSHGAHDHRAHNTIVVQELASHGYVVVTVDHTYDAFVEFPDGRLTVPIRDGPHSLGARDFAADIPFVLDRIDDLVDGRNPDAGGKPLPAGLRGAPDPRRVGMFGASKGGTATALVMGADPRVRAGLSLDAPMEPLVTTDLDRPFMMMTAEFTRAEPPVAQFWSHLTGWKLNIQADGAHHPSYGDYQVLLPQVAAAVGMSDEELRDRIGTLDPARSVRIQQAYPVAFLDLHLRHRRQRLLEGPCAAFPEVRFIP
jgi:predicted dienelactone hydrolase